MRLLHVTPTYLPARRYGGPIYSVHGLCRALAARGHDVHVLTTSVDGSGDSRVPVGRPVVLDGVSVWYFPSRWLRRLYWSPPMAKALRSQVEGFDLLHLHSVFLWPTWAAARAARLVGVPYLVAPRGMLEFGLIRRKSRWVKTLWIQLIERRNLAQAAAVHVTTEREAEEIRRLGLSVLRFVCVPNGVSVPRDDMEAASPNALHRPYVAYIGRINWKKGLDRLIRAWSFVSGADLVLAGNDEEGYRPVLERLAEAEGVAGRVHFVGVLDDHQKWAVLRAAELLVLPSYGENFGNVVLEAMAVGCPVIVTPGVGLADAVARSRAGMVVDGEPQALGMAIARMLQDAAGRATMGQRGRALVQDHYTWEAVAAQMNAAYESLLEART